MLSKEPIRDFTSTETWWNDYHSSYLKIKDENISSIPISAYVFFLLSDFLHALNMVDYTKWDHAIDEGIDIFKVDHLKKILCSLGEEYSEMSKLLLEALDSLEVARKNSQSFSSSDKDFASFEIYCQIYKIYSEQFQQQKDEDFFEFIICRWPEELDFISTAIEKPNNNEVLKKNPEHPYYKTITLTEPMTQDLSVNQICNLGFLTLWKNGANIDQLKDYTRDLSQLSFLKPLELLQNYFELNLSQQTIETIERTTYQRNTAQKNLPEALFPHCILVSTENLDSLTSQLKVLRVFVVDNSIKFRDNGIQSYIKSSLRSDPDFLVIRSSDIKTTGDKFLTQTDKIWRFFRFLNSPFGRIINLL